MSDIGLLIGTLANNLSSLHPGGECATFAPDHCGACAAYWASAEFVNEPGPRMTPEEYGASIVKRLTMVPQGGWDADVVEFETKSVGTEELTAWIAAAICDAVGEALRHYGVPTREQVARAAQAFLTKVQSMTPAINDALAFQANHGFPYSGPSWQDEMHALEEVLALFAPPAREEETR